mmetsp:Transcript_25113/g.42796  ORF Transcript_25113/g.42796 Transcript_25113/m.42796 type:complete len:105 (-) Transcript_25113:136-450(-)
MLLKQATERLKKSHQQRHARKKSSSITITSPHGQACVEGSHQSSKLPSLSASGVPSSHHSITHNLLYTFLPLRVTSPKTIIHISFLYHTFLPSHHHLPFLCRFV